MFDEIKHMEITSVVTKESKNIGKVESRKRHSFIIRISGKMEYSFADKTLLVSEGEIVFLPKGSTYSYRVVSGEHSLCTIINLEGDFGKSEPAYYPLSNFHHADCLLNNFVDLWNFGNAAERYMCISRVYDLLSYIYNYESLKYSDKKKFAVIEPAVKYLKKHIYDVSLKIDELYRLCGVSHTYFRKIFLLEFGMSPKEFVVEKRMSRAKVIIDSGEMDTVKNLALSVGYSDSLYFSKAFKKYYGIPPSVMNNME